MIRLIGIDVDGSQEPGQGEEQNERDERAKDEGDAQHAHYADESAARRPLALDLRPFGSRATPCATAAANLCVS